MSDSSAPKTEQELFQFYHAQVKPLYSAVQLQNQLPVEVLFEINAAFDHLSRRWSYGYSEEQTVQKAYSHLKRSCLDIFKLAVKQAIDQFNELRKIDTSIIDNGQFDQKLLVLVDNIKRGAQQARLQEGNSKQDELQAINAFDLWSPVYENCVILEKEYYLHPKVPWAQKKQKYGIWTDRIINAFIGFALGVLASIFASWIYNL